jgi:hypothetical protein
VEVRVLFGASKRPCTAGPFAFTGFDRERPPRVVTAPVTTFVVQAVMRQAADSLAWASGFQILPGHPEARLRRFDQPEDRPGRSPGPFSAHHGPRVSRHDSRAPGSQAPRRSPAGRPGTPNGAARGKTVESFHWTTIDCASPSSTAPSATSTARSCSTGRWVSSCAIPTTSGRSASTRKHGRWYGRMGWIRRRSCFTAINRCPQRRANRFRRSAPDSRMRIR